jgi:putative transposase
MARKPRIHFDGAIYHVMLRGNDGQNIFFSNDDRYLFYDLIQEGLARYGHRIHGFCLMSNHVHFAIQVGVVSISKIMQNLCFRYTKSINYRQKRIGHLFQGRFKAKMVATDEYFFQLIKYIHLNPVTAKLVTAPDKYQWSSHRAYLNLESIPWVTTEALLSHFGSIRGVAVENYRQFIMQEGELETDLTESNKNSRSNDVKFDQDQFIAKLDDRRTKTFDPTITFGHTIEFVCQYFNASELQLQAPIRSQHHARIRAIIAKLVSEFHIGTLTSVSCHFNRDVTGLIRTLRRLEANPCFVTELADIRDKLVKSTSQA